MSSQESPAEPGATVAAEQVDAIMLGAQLLVGIAAQSVAAVEAEVSLTQLRVLVMIASRGPQNLTALARGLEVHPSNATRTCDRLVDTGLLSRSEDPADRRHSRLELTDDGHDLIHRIMEHRRREIERLLDQISATDRQTLARCLPALSAAGGETLQPAGWRFGWITA